MSGDIRKVGESIKEFITSLINSIRNVANNIISSINSKPAGSVTDKVINIIGEI
jgi:phage-related protein